MNAKKYWEDFWQITRPTEFAKFCFSNNLFPGLKSAVDLGSGGGRDTFYLSNFFDRVLGVDFANIPELGTGIEFKKISLKELLKKPCTFDVVYSRFFLHCIKPAERLALLKWTKRFFMAEWRDEFDSPKLFKDHQRYLVNSRAFKVAVEKEGFFIYHYSVCRNRAKYRGENPLVGRIICERRHK